MNCLPCFNKDDDSEEENEQPAHSQPVPSSDPIPIPSNVKQYNFRELAVATRNFRQECLIGEGGFGRVFKAKLKSGETVAVKQVDKHGMQGNKEFENAIAALSIIQHPNLISLVGYCADGDQRLIVYQYMPLGSLENNLFSDDPDKKAMDWFTRMKIGAGAAQGLEYLHDTNNPPIIFRDLKSSNVLLDENYEPKLSDFANYKLGADGQGDMNPAVSRVMGTYGYSAPEYTSGGELTLKSDIYSFGVVLLELITGRRVIDTNRPNDEQNLVTWAQPIFREPKRFPDLADPRLDNQFPLTGLNQAVGICAMCLQEESSVRPLVGDLVAALSFLAMPQPIPAFNPPQEQKMDHGNSDSPKQETQLKKDGSAHYDSSSDNNTEGEDSDYSSEGESSSHSDSDRADSKQDREKSVETNANRLNSIQGKSREHGKRSLSSGKGSSRKSSSKSADSGKRKVTFKEPQLRSRKDGGKKSENDESSSESEDDEKGS